MERLNQLTIALNVIRRLSYEIISTALPIMEELEKPDNELINELLEKKPNINPEAAMILLQQTSMLLVADAQIVNKEIESFSEAVIHGEDGLSEGETEYPFLLQVWYGDMYEKLEIEGLQAFATDLQGQLSIMDEDKILKDTLSRL